MEQSEREQLIRYIAARDAARDSLVEAGLELQQLVESFIGEPIDRDDVEGDLDGIVDLIEECRANCDGDEE